MKQFLDTIKNSKTVSLVLKFSSEISKSSISAYSGQTAFFFMLSFFPYMIFFFAILRMTPLTEETFMQVLLTIFPDAFKGYIVNIIHDIYSDNISILSLTIVSAVWLGSKSFLALSAGLRAVYHTHEKRNYVLLRLFAFIYSIIFAVLLIMSLGILVFGNSLHRYLTLKFPKIGYRFLQLIDLRTIIAFVLFFLCFLLLYRFLPNRQSHIKYHIPGALTASLGWLLFSYIYSYYVDNISNYSSFYGTMTTFALIMVWLYACIYIFFFGGIINHLYIKYRKQLEINSLLIRK